MMLVRLTQRLRQYEDSIWLPTFVDDLIRGIVRYKIKLFTPPPKTTRKVATKPETTQSLVASGDHTEVAEAATTK